MEEWKDGRVECWKDGMLEGCWVFGNMKDERRRDCDTE